MVPLSNEDIDAESILYTTSGAGKMNVLSTLQLFVCVKIFRVSSEIKLIHLCII